MASFSNLRTRIRRETNSRTAGRHFPERGEGNSGARYSAIEVGSANKSHFFSPPRRTLAPSAFQLRTRAIIDHSHRRSRSRGDSGDSQCCSHAPSRSRRRPRNSVLHISSVSYVAFRVILPVVYEALFPRSVGTSFTSSLDSFEPAGRNDTRTPAVAVQRGKLDPLFLTPRKTPRRGVNH